MSAEKQIREIATAIISEQSGLFLVDLELKGHVGNQLLVVTVDGDEGVQIDQCASISRQLGHQIEERELIGGKYNLEVSSAGLGAGLKLPRQYKKNQGRELNVRTTSGEKYSGTLKSSDNEGIVLEHKDGEIKLNFKEIDKSTVAVSFK